MIGCHIHPAYCVGWQASLDALRAGSAGVLRNHTGCVTDRMGYKCDIAADDRAAGPSERRTDDADTYGSRPRPESDIKLPELIW